MWIDSRNNRVVTFPGGIYSLFHDQPRAPHWQCVPGAEQAETRVRGGRAISLAQKIRDLLVAVRARVHVVGL
jgi:hypothetical protein